MTIRAVDGAGRSSETFRSRTSWTPSPSLKEAATGQYSADFIRRGHSGQSVHALQEALNAAGANPPLELDGKFGPKTQAAIKAFQQSQGIRVDGIVGPETLSRLTPDLVPARDDFSRSRGQAGCAPRQGEPRPGGAVNARDLQQREDYSRRRYTSQSSQEGPVGQIGQGDLPPTGPADGRLADVQRRAVESARGELAAGVREQGGRNRGERVDQYARSAGMSEGGEWCGYFTQFNYRQASREVGGEFRGSLHSFQKARSFFTYGDYTNNSSARNAELAATRSQHESQGSTRRFMVLEGSQGQDWATRNNRAHETYNPSGLPLRAGDTALFHHGHVGMVESYDRSTGRLTTVEGNVGNRVVRKTYDLNDPAVRARFEGFGRPAAGDLGVG